MANGDNENTEQTQSSGVSDFNATAFGNANNFQRKIFKGFSPLLSAKEQKDIQTALGFSPFPTPRQARFVTQPVLFDDEGRVAGLQYNFEDPFVVAKELNKLSTDERIRLANEFKRIGWYGSGKPSEALKSGIGWSQQDEKVWLQLFDVANNAQRPWKDIVGLIGSWSSAGTGGPTVRVTSDEDAAAYTREVFLQSLGRMPTRGEMAEAANFIRNRERQAAASGQQIPNAGLIAQTFAEKQDPTSRVVFGLGNAIGLAMQALGQ